ncbi:hypothetical protein PanWU01x14_181870 [Parasponia andersonii]|uniref:Uncharacterized protein n=1 Tax=Parasponia andersonii TaxID=3476 RepID=A0A2P5C5M7_PARAD|nr:hypothetical protein PanWU01x14_181870 [Parasponia andersonii]
MGLIVQPEVLSAQLSVFRKKEDPEKGVCSGAVTVNIVFIIGRWIVRCHDSTDESSGSSTP